ncbi:hypothetical protein QQS21_008596 [Conoideocrella luteorostrata]|uniref:Uncharacterized protein n=1 Tax=Conoideocrella luteorostrata TaxID=1105319 RepID=A0AAJ0CKX9_9HYPO|nr:hypothetical protein QQS21_008596 [Conoideocrella luteorostrata]
MSKCPLWTRDDYIAALKNSVESDQRYETIMGLLTSKNTPSRATTLESSHITPFLGSLSAKIGFMLDYMTVSWYENALDDIGNHNVVISDELPWQLKGCLFNENNVLVWTHELQRLGPLSMKKKVIEESSVLDDLVARNKEIINASQTQIICICGPRAESLICRILNNPPRYEINLGPFKYPLYVDDKSGRLHLVCPELSFSAWSGGSFINTELSEGIRCAVKLTSLGTVRPYFVAYSSLVVEIKSMARREKTEGAEPVTFETLPDGFHFWLARRGFLKEEDVKELARLAGSIVRGMLAVMIITGHRCRRLKGSGKYQRLEHNVKSNKAPRTKNAFDKSAWQKIVLLYTQLYEAKESEIKARLSGLGIEDNQGSIQEPGLALDNARDDTERECAQTYKSATESALLEFGELETTQPKLVSDIESLMKDTEGQQTATSSEADQDPLMEDILPSLTKQVIQQAQAVLRSRRSRSSKNVRARPTRRKRKIEGQVMNWSRFAGEAFREHEFDIGFPPPGYSPSRRSEICCCRIELHDDKDIMQDEAGECSMRLQFDVREPGDQHPVPYALSATPEDPAVRFGMRCFFTNKNGEPVEAWYQIAGEGNLFRANTLVEMLADQLTPHQIHDKERRFCRTREIPGFEKGSYTSQYETRKSQRGDHIGRFVLVTTDHD